MPATAYRHVGIAAWAGLSPAGDAAATWQAVAGRRRHLVLEPASGWQGRCAAGDQAALGRQVAGALRGCATGRVAVGLGTSKGSLVAWAAAGAADPVGHLPGALSARAAAALGLRTYLPCACAAACSTGLACLLAGADLVERGQADSAIVGASEASLTPLILAGFAQAGVLCGVRPPQAFGEATGFAPAEGAAAFALGRGPAPWRLRAGVRLGDAGHETRFVDPRTLATALAALWAEVPDPDLIVCHATGTAAGDAYELAALADGPWSRCPRLTCKPWIGHALGASGAVELAAALAGPARRLWKLSLGFGGHLVAVACVREPSAGVRPGRGGSAGPPLPRWFRASRRRRGAGPSRRRRS